ncbi:acetyl-CoA carboxylase biotin carboxyl carrier protein [Oceanobacillus sp. Castelsardo]|uniref:acetyl-CoA carboxylase biotin carboxyl carrier protein n=1 Tax=Oceanobacillus sp. Castelsardo TaxID=1851204 RepID=UPI0008387923|nr:acetyl-CoA carboxylase biotin carboxyl carrier protein [Oceanobacillus sp. Castelsardo]
MLKVQEIRELIKLIDKSDISEFTYENDGTSVTMKKSGNGFVEQQQVVTETPKQTVVNNESKVTTDKEEPIKVESVQVKAEPQVDSTDANYEIVSPMVGTFYASPSPDSDNYVSKGSNIQKDTIVCIVEAMKLFNEIEAEVDGEIVEVLVENGELVEYGQPLFKVKTK